MTPMKHRAPRPLHRQHLPLALQRGRGRHYALALALWAVATFLAFAFILQSNVSRLTREFNDYGETLQTRLRDKLRANEAVLYGFASFLGARNEVDLSAATHYANSVLSRYPHIYALEVVRRVGADDLGRFVAAQRRSGQPEFALHECRADGNCDERAMGKRPTYYPIVLVAPETALSKGMLGLDLATRPQAFKGLLQSEQQGVAVSSNAFRLIEGDLAYLMLRPVVHPGEARTADTYAMMVVRAIDLVPPPSALHGNVRHTILHQGEEDGKPTTVALLNTDAEASDAIDAWVLPHLRFERSLEGFSQPLYLNLERQLRLRDLDFSTLLLAALTSALALALVFLYQRAQVRQQRAIEFLALHDSLTGLPNRHVLHGHLEKSVALAQRRHTRLAVLFIDLDHFKPINDRFGHPAGDAVLRQAASRLHHCIRDCDVAARLGGDEFVVLLTDIRSAEDAIHVAEKISAELTSPYTFGEDDIPVGASIGVAVFPDDGDSADAILQAADQAMYATKTGGRNGFGRYRAVASPSPDPASATEAETSLVANAG
ncbi:diguanylate cyclase [Rhodocyclus tenuis]|nr:diguanylate cyclase [Rhodocyclus gracilis]